jgi:cytoskeleton protein RodZ
MPGAFQALGDRFREAREARGLSLSDAGEQIRIRSVYLAAIEEENWSAIGAPVYVRGFLRTYARYLGLDPEEAVGSFNRTMGSPAGAGADEGGEPNGGGRRWGPALIWVAAAVAVLLVAFVVYNELTMRRSGVVAVGSTPAEQASASPETSATPAAASPSPGVSLSPAASAAPSPAASPAPAGVDGANSIALVLSAPSWLRVTVDGNVSMEGTFPAGTSKTFHGKNALVRIGNAGGVEIYVNGKDIGKLGKAGDVVEHSFTL